ncbi:MAG: leucyl aminopeptidase family protein, partial [Planctomycetota bacterium]
DDYRKMMQAKHADLHNSAPVREAHPIQGAAFLSYFVGEDAPKQLPTTPWAHIDIAGTSNTDGGTLMEKGPTSFGVRLTVELIAGM